MIIRRIIGKIVRWSLELPPVEYGSIGEKSIVYTPKISDKNSKSVFIGNNVEILPNSRIQLYPEKSGKNPKITIGDCCYIGYNFSMLAGDDITIKNNVLIASNVLISSENHGTDPESDIPYSGQPLLSAPVFIGEGCWIGERVMILPGVTIGKKCIIGAASVVTKDVPDYCIALGSPAKVVKKYNFETHEWERV